MQLTHKQHAVCTLNTAVLAEIDTIQAKNVTSLAAVMMNMVDMCQGSVKKPLNQACHMHPLAVDSGITTAVAESSQAFLCCSRWVQYKLY